MCPWLNRRPQGLNSGSMFDQYSTRGKRKKHCKQYIPDIQLQAWNGDLCLHAELCCVQIESDYVMQLLSAPACEIWTHLSDNGFSRRYANLQIFESLRQASTVDWPDLACETSRLRIKSRGSISATLGLSPTPSQTSHECVPFLLPLIPPCVDLFLMYSLTSPVQTLNSASGLIGDGPCSSAEDRL